MKIKKCPFCDSEATIKGNIVFGGYSIMCLNDKCGAHVFFYGAEAIGMKTREDGTNDLKQKVNNNVDKWKTLTSFPLFAMLRIGREAR